MRLENARNKWQRYGGIMMNCVIGGPTAAPAHCGGEPPLQVDYFDSGQRMIIKASLSN
jgi:hypothetical protein